MKRFHRKELMFGSVLTILGVIGVFLFNLRDPDVRGTDNGPALAGTSWPGESVRIEGDARQAMSPGVMVPLDLKFTNTQNFDMLITALTVAVRRIDAPNADDNHSCATDDFAVDQAQGDLRITLAARATNTLSGLGIPSVTWPRVGMLNRPVNQDGCKGAWLTLGYTASGTGGNP